ncbi:uncharacterized protein PAC_11990 [Phialocephala subalpina]|uniref:Protein kinase domain-containing protein n=1 Tax=Phialocephala subalpina TaxID=576137 RepID=A0A1L7XAN1_9HELO|nr:uncharacterized protein PAC_11990 [Phialocephala subalpina]
MAQPDEHDAIQAFLGWVQTNVSNSVLDPKSDRRPAFMPLKKIEDYFKENNCIRLKRLLNALFSPDESPVDPEVILQNYIKAFCILVEIGKGRFISHFSHYESLADKKLPFEPQNGPPSYFPTNTDETSFFGAFCGEQWKFCAAVFSSPMANIHYHKDQLLPIIHKERLAEGGSAVLHMIRLHPSYDKLDPKKLATNDPRCHAYVLKTYMTAEAETYYNNETAAFRRLKHQDSNLIGFYGSFCQGNTFNIILEYADKGTLERYFKDCRPPIQSEDIINFWDGLFKNIWAVGRIHNLDFRNIEEGSLVLHGFHQDLKPANILVVSKSDASPYEWDFKLADLGLSHFQKALNGHGPVTSNDAHGTLAYGAPECHRGDRRTQNNTIKIEQSVDMWSLGCVFSEAAVWIANGYDELLKYRATRKAHAEQAGVDNGGGGCFHDGERLLDVVKEFHQDSLAVLRASDYITKDVLDLVSYLLVKHEGRLNAQQCWTRSQTMVQGARARLGKERGKIAGPSSSMASSPSSPHQPPELPSGPPPPRPQGIAQGSVNNFRQSFRADSDSEYHRIAEGVRRDRSPDSITTNGSGRPGLIGNRSSSSGKQYSRPYTQPQSGYPGRRSTHKGVSFSDPEGLAEYARSKDLQIMEETSSNQYDNRNILGSEADETAFPHPDVHTTVPGSFEDYEQIPYRLRNTSHMDYDSRQRDFDPRGSDRGRRGTMFSEAASSRTNKNHAQRTLDSEPILRKSLSTQKLAQHRPDATDQEMPQLSVAELLTWRESMRSKFRSRFGPRPQLPYQYLRDAELAKRDHVSTLFGLPIDDAVSMKPYWPELVALVGGLAYVVKNCDPDGIELSYTISPKPVQSKDSSKLVASLNATTPLGKSNVGNALNRILTKYEEKLGRLHGSGIASHARVNVRPLSLYILTDGVWQHKCDAATPIRTLVKTLRGFNMGKGQVGIQFIRFGNDPTGVQRLVDLDDNLKIKGLSEDEQLDIVDAEPSNGNVWKMLLGSINASFDDVPFASSSAMVAGGI